MRITPLIEVKAELTDGGLPAEPVVLSSRIRLARNLNGLPFPGWAKPPQRLEVRDLCFTALDNMAGLHNSHRFEMESLSALEMQVLVERRLISRELCETSTGAGVAISADQHLAVMINEEDHLRLQTVRSGFNLQTAWAEIDALDSALEDHLDIAFDQDFGYLTACPTNVGTGLRASAMLHLPGLVMQEHMDKVVRMVNQLGMAVRGCFGEGSEATGSIFQISNQQTLGESEDAIINRLVGILHAIIEQEHNARQVILEKRRAKLFDKIGRARGILRNAHLLASGEAMNLLSLLRLGVDLELLPVSYRAFIDRLLMEVQPGHVQYGAGAEIDPLQRDLLRAQHVREQLTQMPGLTHSHQEPDAT
jgi:protein arginine kinase